MILHALCYTRLIARSDVFFCGRFPEPFVRFCLIGMSVFVLQNEISGLRQAQASHCLNRGPSPETSGRAASLLTQQLIIHYIVHELCVVLHAHLFKDA